MNYTIHHFKSLTSTQDKAREFAKKDLSNIIIVSDVQTKGRGRFKRIWYSGKNGLYMSVLLNPRNAANMQYLTFAAAVAVAKAIKKIANIETKIKWPNDVHYKNRKLCGILTEGIFGKENYVIVGIGVNVNQDKFPDEIKNIATSLRIIKNKKIKREKLFRKILYGFFVLYEKYNKNKFKNILKEWKKYCDTINKDVVVITRTGKFSGKVIGIDKNCSLLLKTAKNKIIRITEGDINVRAKHNI